MAHCSRPRVRWHPGTPSAAGQEDRRTPRADGKRSNRMRP
jgi:hypothetical protein